MTKVKFTGKHKYIVDLLSDGYAHWSHTILEQCQDRYDPEITMKNLRDAISQIRVKLRGTGIAIICEYFNRRSHYRLVRLLHPDIEYRAEEGVGSLEKS